MICNIQVHNNIKYLVHRIKSIVWYYSYMWDALIKTIWKSSNCEDISQNELTQHILPAWYQTHLLLCNLPSKRVLYDPYEPEREVVLENIKDEKLNKWTTRI